MVIPRSSSGGGGATGFSILGMLRGGMFVMGPFCPLLFKAPSTYAPPPPPTGNRDWHFDCAPGFHCLRDPSGDPPRNFDYPCGSLRSSPYSGMRASGVLAVPPRPARSKLAWRGIQSRSARTGFPRCEILPGPP